MLDWLEQIFGRNGLIWIMGALVAVMGIFFIAVQVYYTRENEQEHHKNNNVPKADDKSAEA